MLRSLAAALSLSLALTGGASAQNPDRLWHWTGFYVGAGVGGGATLQTQTVTTGFGSLSETTGAGGVIGTVIAGYDYRVSQKIVAGIFVDADISKMVNSDFSGASLPFGHRFSYSAGGRVGLLTAPSTLWYVAAGYTRASFTIEPVGDYNFHGYFAGAGVETRLWGQWSLRGEYRYTNLSNEDLLPPCICGTFEAEAGIHTGRVVLTYALGAAP
jgi:outer membrane immunogenic protein